jgi:hypothetical protein
MYVVKDSQGRYLALVGGRCEWVDDPARALIYGEAERENAEFMARAYGGRVTRRVAYSA